nr:unnamed protein product [Callosobruchus chinensis]CAH7726698.1 unnamed protein product [Callosobruchus chinensis]CAH7728033.1 unnamed protein product [Callosobruchus chinensis]CAH7740515.1 unnamed protein product [Callosobruchus chinensis]CAH7740632.1 unnamed protein product [Callosobruchus chinensis]
MQSREGQFDLSVTRP